MKILSSIYAIACYAIGFLSLLFCIASTGNLLPDSTINGVPVMGTGTALLKDFGLVLLFGLQHSIMARKGFKKWITQYIPKHVERSTYILATGIVVTFMVWQWEPLGGVIWQIDQSSIWYNVLYASYFLGWVIMFISTFLINHFDLFGLRQVYFNLINKSYSEVDFNVVSLYRYTRHPLYLGVIIGIWSTPVMTATHLLFAILLTAYVFVGIHYEEKDLDSDFGDQYRRYKASTPMLLPLKLKRRG